MLTMNLIEIAQILTGTATLIVAIVLLFQIRIQIKTFNLSLKGADRELTYRSVEMMLERFRITIENPEFREIYSRRFLGLNEFSESEKSALFNYYFMFFAQINTDYRLGRLSNEEYYYRLVFGWVLDSKAGQEWYLEEGRDIFNKNCIACHQGGNNMVIPEKNLKKLTLKANGIFDKDANIYQVLNGKKWDASIWRETKNGRD